MDADWRVTRVTARMKDHAWAQLGTSGSGNHFVEFGLFTVANDAARAAARRIPRAAQPLGSRGTGAPVVRPLQPARP